MSSFNAFSDGWEVNELKDTNIAIIDGDRGKNYPTKEEFAESGFCLFLNTGNIVNDSFDFTSCDFISEKKDTVLRKGKLRRKDIILTTRGTVGSVAYYHPSIEHKHVRINSGMVIIRCGEELSPQYIYHLLKSPILKRQYALYSSGAAQPQLPIKDLRRIKLLLPNLDIQKKIAAILSAYDDLIENNKRRIALLEKMAEEIYSEWFVRMRFPGHEKVKFEKGVPDGWEKLSLSRLGAYLNGYAFKPSDWLLEGIPIIKIKELTNGVSDDTPRNSGEDISERYLINDEDIIFSWSATLYVRVWDEGLGLLNQHLFKVTPAEGISPAFLYFSIKFSISIFESLTTGATMQHIKRKELDFVRVNVPPPSIMERFDSNVSDLLKQKLNLSKANRALIKTRNMLLGRLISGKLPVENLDIQFPPSMLEEESRSVPSAVAGGSLA